jgi:hypothetical protein
MNIDKFKARYPEGFDADLSMHRIQMIFKEDKMWRRELLKNKIYSLILIGIGALIVLIGYDGTFFIFTLMLGLPLFFTKENWIK